MQSVSTSLIRRQQVQAKTGLARSTLYKLIANGEFPAPVKITGKAVAWSSAAIDSWVNARITAGNAV